MARAMLAIVGIRMYRAGRSPDVRRSHAAFWLLATITRDDLLRTVPLGRDGLEYGAAISEPVPPLRINSLVLVRPERFELSLSWFKSGVSCLLDYGRTFYSIAVVPRITLVGGRPEIRTPMRKGLSFAGLPSCHQPAMKLGASGWTRTTGVGSARENSSTGCRIRRSATDAFGGGCQI